MKTIALILFIVISLGLHAQQTNTYDYSSAWKKADTLMLKQRPKSALKIINEIYARSKKDKALAQQVKAILYKMNLTESVEEESSLKNLNFLKKELKESQFPVNRILYSVLANEYWDYYQNNRYRFSERTRTENFKNDDISTWNPEQIIEEVIRYYQLSLSNPEKLKAIDISQFDAMLIKGNSKGRSFRPTLYDFLAHRALDLYMSDEPDIIHPAYTFVIKSKEYLSDADHFSSISIQSRDSLSYKFYALKIFQDLIRFHLKDLSPDALIDVDLKRLGFVYRLINVEDKQQVYLDALKRLEQKTIQSPSSAYVSLQIAQLWNESGSKYKPLLSSDHKWDNRKVFDICEGIIKRYPGSDGAAMAFNMELDLKQKSISAIAEKVNVPGVPFRISLTFRNMKQVYWRAIPINRDEILAIRKKWNRNYNVDQIQKLLECFVVKTPVQSGSIALPDDNDFQTHSAEAKMDALPVGEHMILLSASPDFNLTQNALNYVFTTVSNLSYIHRALPGGDREFVILDRTTGQPLSGAKTQIFFRKYNPKENRYDNIPDKIYYSDSAGRFVDYYLSNGLQSFIKISYQNDSLNTLPIDDYEYDYYDHLTSRSPETKRVKVNHTLFFLDRAIYRPGQTIYFKGLLFATDGKNPEILPNTKQKIVFLDANEQEVASKEVTTNEFGTYSGTFTAPTDRMTGQMCLSASIDPISRVYFSVEEYKRPKFEVKMEPLKGTFKLDDTIHFTGKAMAYSGANIDGADVRYRVVRKTRFPWWWSWYEPVYNSGSMEIINGTTKTNADGSFSIDFKAIPDENTSRSADPTFTFTISADITDINGETHTGKTSVNIGYKSISLNVAMKDFDTTTDTTRTFAISATNLSGEPVQASGTIRIWKLKAPEKAFRKRYWSQPDTFTLSKEEFNKLFPSDLYRNEINPLLWENEKQVLTREFNTADSKNLSIPDLNNWQPGKYKLEISGGSKGEQTHEFAYFDVNNTAGTKLPYPAVHYFKGIRTTAEPGNTAVLEAGSSEKITALYELEQDGKIFQKNILKLENEKRLLEIPIKEEYRGNISVHYTFVKDNRLYTQNTNIVVPYTNKQLDIRFETFRDKLQPGQQEQWKIKISGKKADHIAAEMVATLYDASLDAFRPNVWEGDFYKSFPGILNWNSKNGFEQESFKKYQKKWNELKRRNYIDPDYDQLLTYFPSELNFSKPLNEIVTVDEIRGYGSRKADFKAALKFTPPELKEEAVIMLTDSTKHLSIPEEQTQETKVRKNFNETAFFYPQLQTDSTGEIILNFTIPESLTRWKMLGFAHTKDLKSGMITNELVTQKDLMVVPNQPRFFRENDKMIFSAKVTSLADHDLSGNAKLEFFDAITMQPVSLAKTSASQPFQVKAKQSTNLEWPIEIPEGIQAVMYRISASSGNFSDAEEMTLPVVTDRMLVTETLPLSIRGNQTKEFRFEKLLNNTSPTLRNQRFTLEFTSNPAWYAVQAIPYLMEYPYECTEQLFSRYYANSLATHIANSNPKIKRVFDTWATIQPDALLSNLEKNQELKTALLEETPWVLNAKDESQRKRNLALLFDLNRMSHEMEDALKKIREAQLSNGGFSWFKGMPEDRYITQHIIAGMGHLEAMGVKTVTTDPQTRKMVTDALHYLDAEIRNSYEYLKAEAQKGHLKMTDNHLDDLEIHYLYTRSFFKDIQMKDETKPAFDYYLDQAKKYWTNRSIYMQGMIALVLQRNGQTDATLPIIASLNERALHSEEMGMYWKTDRGCYWYEAPIETQALMIEVYDEVAKDTAAVEDLKVWLLKQKQTQDWGTTKATTEACYALLRHGTDMLSNDKLAEITVGNEKIDPSTRQDIKTEAGTGYFKTSWTGPEIKPEMGNIRVSKKDAGVAWGAAYWQYFEKMDKITQAASPLHIKKQLFLQKNTNRGPVISPVEEGVTEIHQGDLIKVRIEIRSDRDMEYIHLKDMRAAGLEPVETLSTYKYQDGLWYYQSTRDLATNFFIGWLSKGTYIFEYSLRASQKGDFSNGITTIQSMYAPEFSSHSEGIRIGIR